MPFVNEDPFTANPLRYGLPETYPFGVMGMEDLGAPKSRPSGPTQAQINAENNKRQREADRIASENARIVRENQKRADQEADRNRKNAEQAFKKAEQAAKHAEQQAKQAANKAEQENKRREADAKREKDRLEKDALKKANDVMKLVNDKKKKAQKQASDLGNKLPQLRQLNGQGFVTSEILQGYEAFQKCLQNTANTGEGQCAAPGEIENAIKNAVTLSKQKDKEISRAKKDLDKKKKDAGQEASKLSSKLSKMAGLVNQGFIDQGVYDGYVAFRDCLQKTAQTGEGQCASPGEIENAIKNAVAMSKNATAKQKKDSADAMKKSREEDRDKKQQEAKDKAAARKTLQDERKDAQATKRDERKDAATLKREERKTLQDERKEDRKTKATERKDAAAEKRDERKAAQDIKKEERLGKRTEKKSAAELKKIMNKAGQQAKQLGNKLGKLQQLAAGGFVTPEVLQGYIDFQACLQNTAQTGEGQCASPGEIENAIKNALALSKKGTPIVGPGGDQPCTPGLTKDQYGQCVPYPPGIVWPDPVPPEPIYIPEPVYPDPVPPEPIYIPEPVYPDPVPPSPIYTPQPNPWDIYPPAPQPYPYPQPQPPGPYPYDPTPIQPPWQQQQEIPWQGPRTEEIPRGYIPETRQTPVPTDPASGSFGGGSSGGGGGGAPPPFGPEPELASGEMPSGEEVAPPEQVLADQAEEGIVEEPAYQPQTEMMPQEEMAQAEEFQTNDETEYTEQTEDPSQEQYEKADAMLSGYLRNQWVRP